MKRKTIAAVGVYSFESKIASCGCHVCKEASWSEVQDGEEVKI